MKMIFFSAFWHSGRNSHCKYASFIALIRLPANITSNDCFDTEGELGEFLIIALAHPVYQHLVRWQRREPCNSHWMENHQTVSHFLYFIQLLVTSAQCWEWLYIFPLSPTRYAAVSPVLLEMAWSAGITQGEKEHAVGTGPTITSTGTRTRPALNTPLDNKRTKLRQKILSSQPFVYFVYPWWLNWSKVNHFILTKLSMSALLGWPHNDAVCCTNLDADADCKIWKIYKMQHKVFKCFFMAN